MGKSRKSSAATLGEPDCRGIAEAVENEEAGDLRRGGLVDLSSRRASARPTGSSSRNEADIGAQIGAQLRNLYDDVLAQPVPDRFLELLNRLETNTISPTRSKTPGEE